MELAASDASWAGYETAQREMKQVHVYLVNGLMFCVRLFRGMFQAWIGQSFIRLLNFQWVYFVFLSKVRVGECLNSL